jgi:hypothetical protein
MRFIPSSIPVALATLVIAAPAIVLPPLAISAFAQGGFTILDDEAEADGYDVTATLQKAPAEWTLAQDEDGNGYRLKINPTSLELLYQNGGKAQRLAAANVTLSPGPIVLQRRGPRWRVLSAGRTVLQAEDDRNHEGQIGFRGGIKDARVQPVEDVSFNDDFMRDAKAFKVTDAAGADTLWRAAAGTWSTSGLTENTEAQVAQTTNPFAFKSSGIGANLALAGQLFWSDYEVEVSVKPEGATAIGLAANAQDDKNYLLFYWPQGAPPELRAVVNGKVQILDRAIAPDGENGGFEQNQWYRLRFSVAGGTLRGWIDDMEVVRAQTGLFGRGQIGLFTQATDKEQSAFFDDVAAHTERDFHDDFSTPVPGRWQTVGGVWRMTNAATPVNAQGAIAVMGERSWKDYTVSAQITLPADTAAGLLLNHRAGEGALWLRVAGSKAKLPYAGKTQIIQLKGGKSVILRETASGSRFDGKTVDWRFSSERGYLKAEADGQRVVDAFSDEYSEGRAGISAQAASSTGTGKKVKPGNAPRILNFAVEFPRERPTWAKVPDLYEEEKQAQTMGGWSTPSGFWLRENGRTGAAIEASGASDANTTLWHKGRFWGDDSVKFPLPNLTTGQSLDILFSAPQRTASTAPATSGASPSANDPNTLKLSLKCEGKTLTAALTRGTTPLGKGETQLAGPPTDQVVQIERRGTYFIVRSGGKDEALKTVFATPVS